MSDYSEDHVIDYPVPVRYELNVIHCPLSAIHVAEDPRFPPGSSAYTARIDAQQSPFNNVTTIRSKGRRILFKNLVSRNIHHIRVGALFGYEEEVSQALPNVRF